jgi:hypothetical protein
MKVSFACPSCDAAGSVDAIHVGKQVRCKHCGAHFAIPDGEMPGPDVYALEEPDRPSALGNLAAQSQNAVFVPSRGDDATAEDRPRRKRQEPSGLTPQKARRGEPEFPTISWLIGSGIGFFLILAAIALLAPQGTWLTGCILMGMGGILILVGHLAGAYGAFSEDFLYGFFYLLIPLYTAYYIVTRWDDMWVWFTCSTVGVGLAMAGIELVRWAEVAV